ncbi:MAG: hypothetical protein J6F30_13490 [Cellulosilyticum sp.]|nr:hypothetical protein [Cellulosilyticum sp.]
MKQKNIKSRNKKQKGEFPIGIVMTTYIIILLMYLFTYSNGLKVFWVFFVIERLMGIHYEHEFDRYFFQLDEDIDEENQDGGPVFSIVVFAIVSVGMYLYTLFKYPGLCCILIVGEVIDLVIKMIKEKIKLK